MKWLRNLYEWVLSWAEKPYGTWALFFLAFAESSFFPVPPDVLLIALAVSVPARSFVFAGVCSTGSVLGGILGYTIGMSLMNLIGMRIIHFYGIEQQFYHAQEEFRRYGVWAVALAGFTPVPYKLFTIGAGALGLNFCQFLVASAVSRSARFFLVGGLIYIFGAPIKSFIDKYFDTLVWVFTLLLVSGFLLAKFVF